MIKEAIILAGGLGTRLRSAVPDLPKCMAPVNGYPFLKYVIDHLVLQGIEHFVFSLGYRHEDVSDWLNQYRQADYSIAIEEQPLGTGGAVLHASHFIQSKHCIVTNGDTLFKTNLKKLSDFHTSTQSHCTIGLKPMLDFDRYGVVAINERGKVVSFQEKKYYTKGLINGGLYALDIQHFISYSWPEKFSFEKDFLEIKKTDNMYGVPDDVYFIDIGIPEDFRKAATEL